MRKVSFRVRNFDSEQYLTFNIDNDAELDEDLLDYLEEEEPEGVVPVIFEENDDFDTFSYDVTDKIHLCELSAQEINAEMVLKVLRGVVISMMNMSEYRIPLSYLVLNRNYIYIDSDYKVEFVCIPLEDMKEEVDLTHFFRTFIASLRFEPSENGDYVAKLLTYVNNRTLFNLRNMLELIEEWMDNLGIEIPDDNSNEIYGEYQEVVDDEPEPETVADESFENTADTEEYNAEESVTGETEEDSATYEAEDELTANESFESAAGSGVVEETVVYEAEEVSAANEVAEEPVEEQPAHEEETVKEQGANETVAEDPVSTDNKKKNNAKHNSGKKDNGEEKSTPIGVVIDDDLDKFLAEKEKEDMELHPNDNNLKIRKNVKVNRASIVQSTKDDVEEEAEKEESLEDIVKAAEAVLKEVGVEDEPEEEESLVETRRKLLKGRKTSRKADKKSDNDEATDKDGTPEAKEETAKPAAAPVPKVNPYLIRVNTEERIMITRQTFKLGKASMGVDYSIAGNGAISRVHAIITGKDGEYFIKDNKSTNHTFVNGKSIEEGESIKLTDNCKIVLGDEEFVFKLQ